MNTTSDNTELRTQIQSLISTQKTFQIDAFDLEEITLAVYGVKIEMLESPNDTTHEFNVNSKLDEYEQAYVNNAIQNKYLECYNFGAILNDLCKKNLIENGTYFIRMSW